MLACLPARQGKIWYIWNMEITKYLHSCLLLEIDGKSILIDPGNYTYDAKVLDINSLAKLDYVLITHEHPDHMYIPFINEIVEKFPEVKITTNSSAAALLEKEGIKASSEETDFIKMTPVPHERMFAGEPPMNTQFDIGDMFSDPGDSHSFTSTKKVLALPVTAPWGSLTAAVKLGISLKPEVIIPIHDWHWNDEAREMFYKRMEDHFGQNGIKFIGLQTGVKVTV